MKQLTLSRTVALDDSWDVIVAGGGPAGSAAAAAAAREGARTLLIEATGCLGGMGTAGLVPAWCPFTDGEKLIYSGIANRVFFQSREGMGHVKPEALHGHIPLDPERLKTVYDDLVNEYGVTTLFTTTLAGVETEGEQVTAVLTANKAGLTAYRATAYVDCTGDADLAAWANAEWERGDAVTGEVMPASHCFILSNVDSYAFANGPVLFTGNPNSPIWEIFRSKKYPAIYDPGMCPNLIGPGTVGFNAGHQPNLDSTDPVAVSRAFMKGRGAARAYRDALAEFYPAAFANGYLAATAPLIGVRESRRIRGDYQLSGEDYFARRSFPDEIARNAYMVDMHSNKENEETPEEFKARVSKLERYRKGESHGIPYRCLLPRGLRNVLVAGRPLSCDRTVHSSIRVMPVCLATGEAAGTAAAMAARGGGEVRAVDVDALRQTLRENGAYLP